MEKKIIQEQRMKRYFIEATKELLKGEGIQVVNVRNVADRAGYSYATLYNYFKDLNELIFECVKDFQGEAEEFVASAVEKAPRGKKRIAAIAKAYTLFFVEYPGVFDLFFVEKMRSLGNKGATATLIYNFLDALCEADWDYLCKQKTITTKQREAKQDLLRNATTGLLIFYMNRRTPESYTEFIALLDNQTKAILDL